MEIERKFLVKRGFDYRSRARVSYKIRQGYIPAKTVSVRIRQRDDKAFLTIKSRITHGFSRYEFEKQIEPSEAAELMKLCEGAFIEKTRYLIDVGKHTFEVDEFSGNNEGLVIAEVELGSEDEIFEKPDFIGREVTGDKRYYNSSLVAFPYCLWRQTEREE